MLPVKKILCPTDFSVPSHKGIEAADELASHFHAELVLINVITPLHPVGPPGIPSAYNITEYYKEMEDLAVKSLANIVSEKVSKGIEAKKIIVHGPAADEIVKHAESEKADLIVIATHGWTGWRRFVFGSVAERVVRSATCPVLTVPCPDEEK